MPLRRGMDAKAVMFGDKIGPGSAPRQWRTPIPTMRRFAALAVLSGALLAYTHLSNVSALGLSFALGTGPRLGPEGLEHNAAARRSATMASPPAPSPSAAAAAPGLPMAAAMAAVALAGALRSGANQRQRALRTLVALRANSPFPTIPAGKRGRKRTRIGRYRAFFKGTQIAVRVNRTTNKAIKWRMHVRAGDTVQVVAGKDKGKVTTVLKTFDKWNKVLCLGVNFCIKHVRPRREDEVGQRVQVEAPMHASCVMHYSEKEQVAGHLGIRYVLKKHKGEELLKKERYNKATGEAIPRVMPPKWVPVLERTGAD